MNLTARKPATELAGVDFGLNSRRRSNDSTPPDASSICPGLVVLCAGEGAALESEQLRSSSCSGSAGFSTSRYAADVPNARSGPRRSSIDETLRRSARDNLIYFDEVDKGGHFAVESSPNPLVTRLPRMVTSTSPVTR